MLRPGKKFYKRPSLPVVAIVVLTALLAIPTTVVLTAKADTTPMFGDPVSLGPTVNSPADEWDPHISPDGLSLYFLSRRPGGHGDADIWVTTRKTKKDPWRTPVNIGPAVDTSNLEGGPCLSADGLELYFTSDRPGGYGSGDLWVTKRRTKDSPWGIPVNLGPKVNSSTHESNPSISTDGLELYFSARWRTGGLGSADIWVTKRKTKDDPWGPAVNLGPTVNTSGVDGSPSLSKDGLSLYFDSKRGYGRNDIWVTTRKTKDGPWRTPVNLGPAVNTLHGEDNPDISSDGSTLYFVSDRPGAVGYPGDFDIWQVSLKAKAKPAKSLHQAAADGDIEQVKSLISEGVDVNAKNEKGEIALHVAVRKEHSGLIKLLIDSGSDISIENDRGRTPLGEAIYWGRRDAMKSFLETIAEFSPIHRAAYSGDVNKLQTLIAEGVDPDVKDKAGLTPIYAAICAHQKDAVALLISGGADVDAQSKGGATPLVWSIWFHDADIVRLLVDAHADVNLPNKSGFTPLTWAIWEGWRWEGAKDIVELLTSRGADIHAADKAGGTPLYWAAFMGDKSVFEVLLDKVVEPTTIHLAACKGDLATVKTFIEKDTDVNVKDRFGCTPLHWAVLAHTNEVADFLISEGASLDDRDNMGSPPLTAARRFEMVKLLISKGADVNAAMTGNGRTRLHMACMAGEVDVAKLLVANGADVNIETHEGRTPLSFAKEKGHEEIVELLLKHGAKE